MHNPTTSNGYTKAQIFLGLLVCGAIFTASPAMAQSTRDLENRLSKMEKEVDTLGRAVYGGEVPQGAGGGNVNAADAEVRMQQLDQQIRDLTGRLEEQDNQINQLKQQLDKLSNDIDVRMQGSTGGGFSNAPSGGSFTANPIQSNPTNGAGGMQYQDRGTSSPPQPQPANNNGYQWNSGSNNSSGQLGSYSESSSGAPTGGGDAAATQYENAFSLLKGAQYDEAEKEFKSFLAQYPGHALTGNATYWLGETYYVRGQFDKAAKTFAEGYQEDPKGPKAADNLLKMGMSLSGLNKKADACVALGQIEKEFPTTAGPVLRRAQQEMTRLGC